jgi:hypothetical protein
VSEDTLHLEHLGACRTAFPSAHPSCALVLLVGEVNPLSGRPSDALFCAPPGCSGHRLQEDVLGMHRVQYLALWRTNLCRGDWRAKPARDRASQLLVGDAPWNVVVMLGRNVAKAFAPHIGAEIQPFTSRRVCAILPDRTTIVVSLPHPSGLCREWKDPTSVPRARSLLHDVAPAIPWGLP